MATVQRQSNIELFRIVMMLGIVAHHFVVNSGLLGMMSPTLEHGNDIYLWLFGMWGKIGINCFVLITGYFMCSSSFTWKKFIKLVCEIEFYKILIYLGFVLAGRESISGTRLFQLLSPITDLTTEFISGYLVMFLLVPFMNILIQNLSKDQHLSLIALSLLFFTIWDQFPGVVIPMGYPVWLCVIYIIGAYLRKYPIQNNFVHFLLDSKVGALIMLVTAMGSVIIMLYLHQIGITSWWPHKWIVDYNAPLAVLTSISLFNFFRQLNIKPNRWINTISASTFGVFLIHTSSDAMRAFLWGDICHCTEWHSSPWLPLYSILVVCAIFAVCTLIDVIRIRIIEKPFMEKIISRVTNK